MQYICVSCTSCQSSHSPGNKCRLHVCPDSLQVMMTLSALRHQSLMRTRTMAMARGG